MKFNTASEVISFARQLEEDGSNFYRSLAEQYTEAKETLLSFAEENRKNVIQVERSYYGVITDALEGCFSFKLDPSEYTYKHEVKKNTKYSDALNEAMQMESKTAKFYSDAAEQSKSLLADVPRTFVLIAKKRNNRLAKLQSLLSE